MSGRQLICEDIILLSQELQAILNAGVPLDTGLRELAAGSSGALESAAQQIASRLEQGQSLAEAIQAESRLPANYRMVLVAGIRCGRSQDVLTEIIRMSRGLRSLQQTFHRGLVYPSLVVLLAAVLFGMLATTYLPRLASLYRFLRIDLPVWLLSMERLEPLAIWTTLAIGICGLLLAQFAFGNSRSLTLGLRWIPGGSRLLEDLNIGRISRLLSLLLKFEIPLPEALRLVASTVDSADWRTQLKEMAESVERGATLSEISAGVRRLPAFLRWLIVTGNRESQLAETLRHAAEFYEDRAWARGELLHRLIPALLMLIVGGSATLLYALSVFGPMIQLWQRLGDPLG